MINANELANLTNAAKPAAKKTATAKPKAASKGKKKEVVAPVATVEVAAPVATVEAEKTIFNDAVLACEEMHRMLDIREKNKPSNDTRIAKKHCKFYSMQVLIDLGILDREYFDMFARWDKDECKKTGKNFVPVKVQVKVFTAANCIAQGNVTLIDQYSAALIANSWLNGGKLHKSLVALTLQKKLEYSADALEYAKGKMLRYRCNVQASTASTQGSSSKGENGLFKYLRLGHFDSASGLLNLDLENVAVKKLCDILIGASDLQVAELKGEKV